VKHKGLLSDDFDRRVFAVADVLNSRPIRRVRWRAVRILAVVATSIWSVSVGRLMFGWEWSGVDNFLLLAGAIPAAGVLLLVTYRRTWGAPMSALDPPGNDASAK
jgi:hypothetical protein